MVVLWERFGVWLDNTTPRMWVGSAFLFALVSTALIGTVVWWLVGP